MAIEIERKFLLSSDAWKNDVSESYKIDQSYLFIKDGAIMRVSVGREGKAYIAIKIGNSGSISRQEYEYEIPNEDAEELSESAEIVTKIRNIVRVNGNKWEIDEFIQLWNFVI